MLATLILVVAAAATVATAQTFTDLYNFSGNEGVSLGFLAQGRDGNLYGTAYGGISSWGNVFKITPSGTLTPLYEFGCCIPVGGLTLGTDGNFYGVTVYGGSSNNCTNGCGTIFKITKGGSLTTLYSFTGGTDGRYPYAPPIQGTDGNFYGTTNWGPGQYTDGTAYKITSSGTFTFLSSLPGESFFTAAPLLQAPDGNFYGTTESGGSAGYGTVFKMTPKGIVSSVYSFDGTHGESPYFGSLAQGSDGNFYGTTSEGGSYGQGVVFKLTPQGAITVLHNFPDPSYPNDGFGPLAGLVQATDGKFYGVTYNGGTMTNPSACVGSCGVIFQITPDGAYSILYNFDGPHGANPEDALLQHTNGKIYGLTTRGGAGNEAGNGSFYSLDMGLGPFVAFVRNSGEVGQTVEILGQGFTGTTSVSFNGTPATFEVSSDTYLTATVPAGATTGILSVIEPSGTLKSNKEFRVMPQIFSFTPTSGPVGTSVVITGESFAQATGAWLACKWPMKITVDSDTQITATIPADGTTGEIMVFTPGGHVESTTKFTVTP
ncbi:MAG: choice-of-anchor tandem repeat GloVer-containing protein [Candidatus Sulfotelmatobacter sp.]